MLMMLTPRGPGTSICWSRDKVTSLNIFPAAANDGFVGKVAAPQLAGQRHHEGAAKHQRQPVAELEVLHRLPVNCLLRQFAVANQHLLLVLEVTGKLLGQID